MMIFKFILYPEIFSKFNAVSTENSCSR